MEISNTGVVQLLLRNDKEEFLLKKRKWLVVYLLIRQNNTRWKDEIKINVISSHNRTLVKSLLVYLLMITACVCVFISGTM